MNTLKKQNIVSCGKLIRHARQKSNVSLRHLAKQVDISPTYLSQIENGTVTRPPAFRVIETFAFLLDLDTAELCRLAGRLPDPVRDMLLADRDMLRRLYKKACK